ncbi:hypothetical protein L2E82_22664 [Cichorium intybus]|uniref:Uncharacterized protein n=1 Tax=Cichorium intybus TaxID=13427 RepID=A0ACB9DY07_CICIN|nr:hypothetical protein L2E82_22664 [Cichorium intybus]
MESTIAFAMILQKFDVELKGSPESVELVTGAIIHTKNGLLRKLKNRSRVHEGVEFRNKEVMRGHEMLEFARGRNCRKF